MKIQHPQKRQGFTLVEVLVALLILIVGIVGVLQFFPTSLVQARIAAERTVTSERANSILGQVRQSSAAALFYNMLPPGLLNVSRGDGFYGYNATVTRLVGANEVYLQRITFTVEFADDRIEKYVTYVAQQ